MQTLKRGLGFLLVLSAAVSAPAHAADITFTVEVPWCTPHGAQIYVRSNRQNAAQYRHDLMTAVDPTHYTVTLAVNTPLEQFNYRYSHGICDEASCKGIEKALAYLGSGEDIPDRVLSSGQTSTADRVVIWRDAMRVFDGGNQPVGLRSEADQVAFCGPYLGVFDADGNMSLGFDAYDAETVKVEWGTTPAMDNTPLESTGTHRNHLRFPALPPNTTVHYRVKLDGDVHTEASFRTAPAPGDAFTVGFIGDLQYVVEEDLFEQRQLVDVLAAANPDLLLASGDLVHSVKTTGPAFDDPEPARWNLLYDVIAPLVIRAPFITAMGNHEEDAPYFWDVFDFPITDPPKLDHFAFKWGNLHVTVMYTGVTDGYDYEGILNSQTPWLESTLSEADADPDVRWKVVILHRGPFSQGANHPTDGEAFANGGNSGRQSWRSIWEAHDVNLVLAGHNHNFTLANWEGVHYLTSCSGAPIHPLRDPWNQSTIYAESTCAATVLDVTATTLGITSTRPNGTIIDEARIDLCHEAEDCAGLDAPCAAPRWSCATGACVPDCTVDPDDDGGDPDGGDADVPNKGPTGGCDCASSDPMDVVVSVSFFLLWAGMLRRRRTQIA